MKGKFIVFEGIDGSGSSTQAELLHQYFRQQNIPSVLSPEPSNGIIGNLVREALRKRFRFTDDPKNFNRQMAYLSLAIAMIICTTKLMACLKCWLRVTK